MTNESSLDPPRYGLFCATWGLFDEDIGLPDLPQTANNSLELAKALNALDAIDDSPVVLHDESGQDTLDELEAFLSEAREGVVLYLSSHGLPPVGGNPYFRLATGATKSIDDMTRSFVVWEAIERLAQSSPGRKLLILDTCYAGKASSAMLALTANGHDLPPEICVLAATNPFTSADVGVGDELTAFTRLLSEILRAGDESVGPEFAMRSVFTHLKAESEARGMPEPWLVTTGGAAETVAFRNPAAELKVGAGQDFGELVAEFDHRIEILYVEDLAGHRGDFKDALESAGHHVTLASDPIEAEQALGASHFDIVVVDLFLIDDHPATELIELCSSKASDSKVFLVSRQTMGSEDAWAGLDSIFPDYHNISAFFWKPDHIRAIEQHANAMREQRRNVLAHVSGVEAAVALAAERMIRREQGLGEWSERLQLQLRVAIEKLVGDWFSLDDGSPVYIEKFTLAPVDGGRSASVVFKMEPVLRGLEPRAVTPLILKLGPRRDIHEEIRRFDRYVQVGVPLEFRTDKLRSVEVGSVGGIIYSFRGNNENAIVEVAQLGPDEIENCLQKVFGSGNQKRWYASKGTGDGALPIDHFGSLGFGRDRYRAVLPRLRGSLAKSVAELDPSDPAASEVITPVFEEIARKHESTLVHGDLSLENLVRTDDSRYSLIDYRTVGLGPRLIDFVTLEIACWLLAKAPDSSRSERFRDAWHAVPRTLVVDAMPPVADWLTDSSRLAASCRSLAVENHPDATLDEYGVLLWFAAVRRFEFNSRAHNTSERNAERALLPALALAGQAMISG